MFGHKKGLEKKLMESGGTVAWATVLEGKERWSSSSGVNYGYGGHVTDHMHLKLRVEPEGEPPFEAELSQAFPGIAPLTGSQCRVVYDPADRSKIVVIDGSVHPPGITHEQALRSEALRAEYEAAAANGTVAELVRAKKAAALRGELGGITIAGGQILSGGSAPQPTVVDQLSKLADLHDRGALTDAEFEAQKAKLLADN